MAQANNPNPSKKGGKSNKTGTLPKTNLGTLTRTVTHSDQTVFTSNTMVNPVEDYLQQDDNLSLQDQHTTPQVASTLLSQKMNELKPFQPSPFTRSQAAAMNQTYGLSTPVKNTGGHQERRQRTPPSSPRQSGSGSPRVNLRDVHNLIVQMNEDYHQQFMIMNNNIQGLTRTVDGLLVSIGTLTRRIEGFEGVVRTGTATPSRINKGPNAYGF